MSKEKTKIKSFKMYYPLLLTQTYLLLTIIFFYLGPIDWVIKSQEKFALFLFITHLFMIFGFLVGTRISVGKSKTFDYQRLLVFCLVISIISFIPAYYLRTGMNLFDFNSVIKNTINGFLNPGEQYYNKIIRFDNQSINPIVLFFIGILAPFQWLYIPLVIFHWKSVGKRLKIITFVLLFLEITSWISIGTNKGIFDIIILLISSYILHKGIAGKKKGSNYFIKKILLFIVLAIGIVYFTSAISARVGNIEDYTSSQFPFDENRILYMATPEFLKPSLVALDGYLTQGYYGLALSIDEPFTSTYGFGSSVFLTTVIERTFDTDYFTENSFPTKIEKYGWDRSVNWHSAYTWIASDFSFILTPFIFFFIFLFMAVVWKEIIINENPYAIGLFSLLVMFVFYIPANNQVFSIFNTFFAFWGILFIYLFKKFTSK